MIDLERWLSAIRSLSLQSRYRVMKAARRATQSPSLSLSLHSSHLEGRGNRVHGHAVSLSWGSQLVALQHEKRRWNVSIFAHILKQH